MNRILIVRVECCNFKRRSYGALNCTSSRLSGDHICSNLKLGKVIPFQGKANKSKIQYFNFFSSSGYPTQKTIPKLADNWSPSQPFLSRHATHHPHCCGTRQKRLRRRLADYSESTTKKFEENAMETAVFLPGFSTLGSTGPKEKLNAGHEGEKRVTIFRYS